MTNRIVILLSPIFVGLSGWIVECAARYLPGAPKLDETELTVIFGLGMTAAAAKLLSWLQGWKAYEARLPQAPARRRTPATKRKPARSSDRA